MALLPVHNEVFRLRTENRDLRGQICASKTELNKLGKISRYQRSLIPRLEDEIQNLREEIESREFQCETAAMGATEAKMKLAAIKSQIQELRATGDKVQEVLRQKEVELQQSLEELRKLQATKEREEHKSVQDSSAAQSCSWPRWLVTCGRSWRWINSGSLFGNSPRATRVSKDPAQHGSCSRPKTLMGQVGKN